VIQYHYINIHHLVFVQGREVERGGSERQWGQHGKQRGVLFKQIPRKLK
jgi:hypothetical protein